MTLQPRVHPAGPAGSVGGRAPSWEGIFWLTSTAVFALVIFGGRSGESRGWQLGALLAVIVCYVGLRISVDAAPWRRYCYIAVLLVAFTLIAYEWNYSPALLYQMIPQIWMYLHRVWLGVLGHGRLRGHADLDPIPALG